MDGEWDRRIGRRGLMKCLGWGGTGLLWSFAGGVPGAAMLGSPAAAATTGFRFVQISDSHIGFSKPANPDAKATFAEAVAKIGALDPKPDFVVHTGDVSQLSKPEQWDDADQILKTTGLPVFHIPGEHDMLDEGGGQAFLAHYGKGAGGGWYSFDHGGVHFVALNNVADLKAGGAGSLGAEQLAWLSDDLRSRRASAPLVVFAHIPLWALYPQWGWATDDSAQALALMKGFGSVTVLNGHIHQVMQKVEGHVAFHTARSTAFPQPAPGTASAPGPLKVPADQLKMMLGLREVDFRRGSQRLAITETPLA